MESIVRTKVGYWVPVKELKGLLRWDQFCRLRRHAQHSYVIKMEAQRKI